MNNFSNTLFWKPIDKDKIECELCPRNCQLALEQRGFCFVRQNIKGKMVLSTYGQTSGFAIDPIEKKPLNHFLPGTTVLSFGTIGCNLGCDFCQNWSISKAKNIEMLQEEASPKKIALMAQELGCKSVAFTYNEPIIFLEYVLDTIKECRKLGIKTVGVTAGWISKKAMPIFFDALDAVNIDLKSIRDDFYRKYCKASLQPVLDSIVYSVKETNTWVELTTLLIPGKNDSDQELDELTDWIVSNIGLDTPLHFTAFIPNYKMKDISNTNYHTLIKARQIALQKGIKYVYTGNISDSATQSTYCPVCHKNLIQRNWHKLDEYHIKNSSCDNCGQKIAGVFDNI